MRLDAGKRSRRTWLLRSLRDDLRKSQETGLRTRLYNAGPQGSATILLMLPDEHSEASVTAANPFTAADILSILRERGWLTTEPSQEQQAWCERAAAMLGGHAADRTALAGLIGLVFQYDAREIISRVESHVVLSRYAARNVLRQVALMLLDGGMLTPERFKEIVTAMKEGMELRGRELFHPIRLALAGRAGEGELDRVILLLDEGAVCFVGRVKSARERIVEFCSALD
jgi:Anticodon binding domain